MQLTPSDIAQVSVENLRVPLAAFVAAWREAERAADDPGSADWYLTGVVATFRWLGRATIRPASGPWFSAPAPVSGRRCPALPETVEAEWRLIQALCVRRDDWADDRAAWLEGVVASFAWAWCGSGPCP